MADPMHLTPKWRMTDTGGTHWRDGGARFSALSIIQLTTLPRVSVIPRLKNEVIMMRRSAVLLAFATVVSGALLGHSIDPAHSQSNTSIDEQLNLLGGVLELIRSH
jgi:hypothetical protein